MGESGASCRGLDGIGEGALPTAYRVAELATVAVGAAGAALRLFLPNGRDEQPDREFLEFRYAQFRQAS